MKKLPLQWIYPPEIQDLMDKLKEVLASHRPIGDFPRDTRMMALITCVFLEIQTTENSKDYKYAQKNCKKWLARGMKTMNRINKERKKNAKDNPNREPRNRS